MRKQNLILDIRQSKRIELCYFHDITRRAHSSSSSESESRDGIENGTSKKERLEEQRKRDEKRAEEERIT